MQECLSPVNRKSSGSFSELKLHKMNNSEESLTSQENIMPDQNQSDTTDSKQSQGSDVIKSENSTNSQTHVSLISTRKRCDSLSQILSDDATATVSDEVQSESQQSELTSDAGTST
jgi:hypothetical protein